MFYILATIAVMAIIAYGLLKSRQNNPEATDETEEALTLSYYRLPPTPTAPPKTLVPTQIEATPNKPTLQELLQQYQPATKPTQASAQNTPLRQHRHPQHAQPLPPLPRQHHKSSRIL